MNQGKSPPTIQKEKSSTNPPIDPNTKKRNDPQCKSIDELLALEKPNYVTKENEADPIINNPTPGKNRSQKIKPPIKTKPDLSKYKPTQEIPSFLKSKLPHNRHSMDPAQFRSTVLSFEALTNAALRKAEIEYNNTKEEFLLSTSLPEFQKEKG